MFGYCAVVETHEEATNLRRHLEESIHLRMCVIDGLEMRHKIHCPASVVVASTTVGAALLLPLPSAHAVILY